MEKFKKEYKLTNQGINECIERLNLLKNENVEEKDLVLKMCLSYETVLLNLQQHFGEDKSIILKEDIIGKKLKIEISYVGDEYNPLFVEGEDLEIANINNDILIKLGVGLVHFCKNKKNRITSTLTIKRRMSLTTMLLIGAIAGVFLGIIGRMIPENIQATMKMILSPISSMILGFIKMSSFPIIFLSIICGIVGCGNITTFGKMGKKTIISFFTVMSLLEIATTIFLIIVFKVNIFHQEKSINFLEMFIDTIFNMFPNNIVKPFVNENCVQIVFLAIMVGCALLLMGDKAEAVSKFCDQLNEAWKIILNWFCSFIPFLVAILLAKSIWEGDSLLKCISVWKALLIEFVAIFILIGIEMFRINRKTKIPYKNMIAYVMPATLKAFSTGSTYCAYTDITKAAEQDFKVKKSEVEFYSAMGVSFFKTSFTMYSVIVFYFAYLSNAPISLGWILSFIIVNILFSVSTPSVAGGGVAILALLFEIFVSSESLYFGVASSILVIMDFFTTALRVLLMILEIKLLGIASEEEAKSGQNS